MVWRIICQLGTSIVKVTWKKYTSFVFELSKTQGLFVIAASIPLMNIVIHSFGNSFNFFIDEIIACFEIVDMSIYFP